MDEREFQQKADRALSEIYSAVSRAADDYGFEPDFSSGALSIEFDEPPGRFVLSPNSPVRQIWVSAHATSFKLDWDESRKEFVLKTDGRTLRELLEEAIGRQLGQPVQLT
ncbi:MAG: iron donor protein CyaY [Bryobacteraceae bacterium]|nr:iron donor protein CyaY [Bryobacteraceae bacterium]